MLCINPVKLEKIKFLPTFHIISTHLGPIVKYRNMAFIFEASFEESVDLPLPDKPEKITKEPIFIRDPFK